MVGARGKESSKTLRQKAHMPAAVCQPLCVSRCGAQPRCYVLELSSAPGAWMRSPPASVGVRMHRSCLAFDMQASADCCRLFSLMLRPGHDCIFICGIS